MTENGNGYITRSEFRWWLGIGGVLIASLSAWVLSSQTRGAVADTNIAALTDSLRDLNRTMQVVRDEVLLNRAALTGRLPVPLDIPLTHDRK